MAKQKETSEELLSSLKNMDALSIRQQLFIIQQKVNAPKTLSNGEKGFKYRNVENLLEDVIRPLCRELGCCIVLVDEVVNIGGVNYVKTTATLLNTAGESIESTAFAREHYKEEGKYPAQITGSCSSYARKYAICGLFAIGSGEKELDSDVAHDEGTQASIQTAPEKPQEKTETAQSAAAAPAAPSNIVINNNAGSGEGAKVTVVSPNVQVGSKTAAPATTPTTYNGKERTPLTPDLPIWGKVQVNAAKSELDAMEVASKIVSSYIITPTHLCLLLKQAGKIANDDEFGPIYVALKNPKKN